MDTAAQTETTPAPVTPDWQYIAEKTLADLMEATRTERAEEYWPFADERVLRAIASLRGRCHRTDPIDSRRVDIIREANEWLLKTPAQRKAAQAYFLEHG